MTFAESEFESALPEVIGELIEVTARDAGTREEMEEKEEHAQRATALVEPFKGPANLWLSVAGFGASGDKNLLRGIDAGDPGRDPARSRRFRRPMEGCSGDCSGPRVLSLGDRVSGSLL